MQITGKYEQDQNFTTVYTEDTLYTVARSTGDWSSVKIGDRMANGYALTPDLFRQWKAECTEEGTFHLSEN